MKFRAGTLIIVSIFLAIAIGNFSHQVSSSHLSNEVSDCLLMISEKGICSMSAIDHISAWKSTFLSVVPTFSLLVLTLLGLALPFLHTLHRIFRNIHQNQLPLRALAEQTYSFSCRQFQDLFSDGILHPKLF